MRTTSTNSANLRSEYYVKKALMTLQPRLQLYNLGKKTGLPKGEGTLAKWLIYTRISSSTNALTQGVPPSAIAVSSANVTKSISQYGQYTQVSDLLDDTAIDPVVSNISELMGKAASETIEDLIVAELDATLTARYASGRANANAVTSADITTLKDFLASQVYLRTQFVAPHEKLGKYAAVLHANTEYDLLSETNIGGWLDVNSYVGMDKATLMKAEVGSAFNMRFMTSDKMTAAANSSSVSLKNNYLIGEECFGVVELGSKNFEIITKDRKSGGVSNPLEQWSTVGYKLPGFAVKNFAATRGVVLKGATSFA